MLHFRCVAGSCFSGCTRIQSTEIGGGLIPAVDGVITKDTLLDVVTDTFDDADSARVYRSDNQVVGAITNDPLFGKTKASVFFEVSPSFFPYYIAGSKDSLVIDSVVLVLSYKGVYGDSTAPLRLHVFEIDHNTPLDRSRYYPANYPATFPANLGPEMGVGTTYDIRTFDDSVNNRYENAANQVRIRLNNAVGTRFLKTYDSTNAYLSDSVFRTFFAGFAVTADASGGANALVKVNLSDTNTKFAIYYNTSSTGATKRDTSVALFSYNALVSGNANFIVRDRSGSEMNNHITTTSRPDSLVYVQTSPGSYVRIRIPGLQALSNRIVHRAELITEQVPDDANLTTIDAAMAPPRYLLLSHYDSGQKVKRNIPNDYIADQTNGPNISTFGGYKLSKSINGYASVAGYTFDLSRYVQGIVTRKDTSFSLRLTAPANDSLNYTPPYPLNTIVSPFYLAPSFGNDLGDGRVRLGGGSHTRFRMRLRVIYSRL